MSPLQSTQEISTNSDRRGERGDGQTNVEGKRRVLGGKRDGGRVSGKRSEGETAPTPPPTVNSTRGGRRHSFYRRRVSVTVPHVCAPPPPL